MINIINVISSQGLLSDSILTLIERYMASWNISFYDALLDCHILSEKQLAGKIAGHMNTSYILSVTEAEVKKADGFSYLSYEKAKELRAIFVTPLGESESYLLVADPTAAGLKEFFDSLPFSCRLAIGEKSLINTWIDDFYPIEQQLPGLF